MTPRFNLFYKGSDGTIFLGMLNGTRIVDWVPVSNNAILDKYNTIKLSEFILVEITDDEVKFYQNIKEVRVYNIQNAEDKTKDLILGDIPAEDRFGLANNIIESFLEEQPTP